MATRVTTVQFEPWVGDAIRAEFLAPFLDGRMPFVIVRNTDDVAAAIDLVPDLAITRSIRYEAGDTVLAAGSGWSVLVDCTRSGRTTVTILAETTEILTELEQAITSNFPEDSPAVDQVAFDFWTLEGRGMQTSIRSLRCPSLDDLGANYPAPVLAELTKLSDVELSDDVGRILLWHGPPGTGKTTAIRALARQWSERGHRFQILLDPDAVFGQASRLTDVLLDRRNSTDDDVWRILVVEDADELIRADAKERVGQSLSRLLNLGDGLLGQGTRVVVLITTNEPTGRLHPALVRPGRCLAEIDFRRFTRSEATEQLGTDPGTDLSLAELVAWRRGDRPSAAELTTTGQYL